MPATRPARPVARTGAALPGRRAHPARLASRLNPVRPGRTTGQTRTIDLADGGTLREELVEVRCPDVFAIRLTDITGPLRPLASSIDGRWEFEPAGTGVRIAWQWAIHPTNRAGALLLPTFARLWQGFARQALDGLEDVLVA